MKKHRVWFVLSALALAATLSVLTLTVGAQPTPVPEPRIIRPPWPPRPIPVPPPALNQELQLISQAARVDINGAVARTRLTQTFQNVTNRRIEGTYVFPLPEGAAVSGFAMTVNGKRVEAEILEGDKAREIYTGIVQKMRDPAILEFIDRNLIRAKIFPIEPRAEQKVELEYSEALKADANSFRYVVPLRLPVGGAARNSSVDVRINSPGGIRAVYSPTHNVETRRDGDTARVTGEFGPDETRPQPVGVTRDDLSTRDRSGTSGSSDRDFVLYYTTARERVGVNLITHRSGDEDGYFMLLVAPDPTLSQKEIAAKDVVFVFDTSGSMAGEKIEQARKALLNLLGNLNPDDRFNIVTFSSDVRTFRDGLTPVNTQTIDAARDFVRAIKAVGGTNINDALVEALKMMKAGERPQQIVFMTDGQPTVGETDVAQILKNVREANRVPFTRVFEDSSDKANENTPTKSRELPLRPSAAAPGTILALPESVMARGGTSARIFVFGVGYDVNTRLLDTIAEDNRGASDYVLPNEDIEQKVGSLYSKIAYPVLSNPRLDWSDMKVYDVYPKRLPDLFRGTQTVVFGRYEGRKAARVQLIGSAQGREERIAGQGDFSDEGRFNDMLPRLWAMRKVGYLLDDARRSERPIDNEVKDEIIRLSKRYGIVTPYTAGLITEDERVPVLSSSPIIGQLHRNHGAADASAGAAGGFGGAGGPAGARGERSQTFAYTAPVDRLGSLPSSGQAAVAASKATAEMREAGKVKDDANVRYVEERAFFLKDGVWTDGTYDEQKSPKLVTVKFASPEYFALIKDPKVAKWLSVGERVIVVLKDKTVKIEP